MPEITTQKILTNKRLTSLELQILNFLGDNHKSISEIHIGFRGLASKQTIKDIVTVSPFFEIDDDIIVAFEANHKANVTYDFQADSPSAELFLSGISAPSGEKQNLANVSLTVGLFEIGIKVIVEGTGNWKLNVRAINVTGPGPTHKRSLVDNPLEGEGTYVEQLHVTEIE